MALNGDTGSEDGWLARARERQVVGTIDEAAERLGELAEAGLDRVMLQHLLHSDLEMVRLIGEVASRL
jgi:alkanesulfonate monooxygenase SsuD/methylene tetrahydromethanopterin reductase-like flavin-dependent oxidoreductase (luciferase family)